MRLDGDQAGWVRSGEAVIAATPPAGYAESVATLLDGLRSSPAWQAWWARGNVDHLVVRQGYYTRFSQHTDVLSSRPRRRKDHTVAVLTVVFDPLETRTWPIREVERRAESDVRSFFDKLADRLRLPPTPPLPELRKAAS